MKKVYGILILFILLIPTVAHANSFKFVVDSNKTVLKNGEEIELHLNINDIDIKEGGINAIEATLDYDNNVFEPVTIENFKGLNNWTFSYNDTEKKMLGIVISSGITNNQEIGILKLKVKNNVENPNKSTTIKIQNIATSNGIDLVKEENKEIELSLEINNINIVVIIFVVAIALIAIILGLISIKKSKRSK